MGVATSTLDLPSVEDSTRNDEPEVLFITSNGRSMTFRKGNWTVSETGEEAAARQSLTTDRVFGYLKDDDSQPINGSLETSDFHRIDIELDKNSIDLRKNRRINRWKQKISLGGIFVITNFVLELPSAVLDQLSSVHKPRYALLAMLISFTALFLCVAELVYKGRKQRVVWMWKGMLPWFYKALENYKPFGTFNDIIGSVCALCQCVVSAFNNAHTDNPIQISVWPIIFAFGLLWCKMSEKSEKRT